MNALCNESMKTKEAMSRKINKEVVCCSKCSHKGELIWQKSPINKDGKLLRKFQIFLNAEKTDIVENGFCSYCALELEFPDMKYISNLFLLIERIISLLIEELSVIKYRYFIDYEMACCITPSNTPGVNINYWNKILDKNIDISFVFDFKNENILFCNKKFSSKEMRDLAEEIMKVL